MEKTDLQRECWEQVRTASNAIEGLVARRAKEDITEVQLVIEVLRNNGKIQSTLRLMQKEGL
jgi:hypothetical protein